MQASDLPSRRQDPDRWPDAACRGKDPDIFFPDDDRNSAEAIAICNTCPVLHPCREYALDARERHGVWGGLSEQERRAIWKRRGLGNHSRDRHCANPSCARPFTSTAHNARFCSSKCRYQVTERRRPQH